ncbi:MAG: TetR/AcrR family transcriptional regulator [Novosphingobium sp.]|nr:TetR/AcrR family transcriptional regulator [Novosphingobium sp.]
MTEGLVKIDARMQRTQEALRVGMLVLLERSALADISIRDIVAEAGIGYATFFRHYASKNELLQAVITDEIEQLVDLSLPVLRPGDSLESSLALFHHVDEHRALWSALLTGGAAGTIREEFARIARDRGPSRIHLDGWLPLDLGVAYGVAATVEIIAWWLRNRDDFSVERIAAVHDRLVLRPTVTGATPA